MRKIFIFLAIITFSMTSCLKSDDGLSFAEQAAKNAKEGEEFLAENAKNEDVIILPSGLQYKILEEGNENGESPDEDDTVVCHYKGYFIDGNVFDSSYDRGQTASFPVNRVIKGWTEALQLMKKGSKWQLFIPYNLAYGEYGRGSIGPKKTLIFDVELIDIVKQ